MVGLAEQDGRRARQPLPPRPRRRRRRRPSLFLGAFSRGGKRSGRLSFCPCRTSCRRRSRSSPCCCFRRAGRRGDEVEQGQGDQQGQGPRGDNPLPSSSPGAAAAVVAAVVAAEKALAAPAAAAAAAEQLLPVRKEPRAQIALQAQRVEHGPGRVAEQRPRGEGSPRDEQGDGEVSISRACSSSSSSSSCRRRRRRQERRPQQRHGERRPGRGAQSDALHEAGFRRAGRSREMGLEGSRKSGRRRSRRRQRRRRGRGRGVGESQRRAAGHRRGLSEREALGGSFEQKVRQGDGKRSRKGDEGESDEGSRRRRRRRCCCCCCCCCCRPRSGGESQSRGSEGSERGRRKRHVLR